MESSAEKTEKESAPANSPPAARQISPSLSSRLSSPLGRSRNASDERRPQRFDRGDRRGDSHYRFSPAAPPPRLPNATCDVDWNQVPRELQSPSVLCDRFDTEHDREWATLEQNLHTLQYRATMGKNPSIFPKIERILKPDAAGEPYRRRKGECKTVLHWGQRKLLFSEIEFLTLFSQPDITVVYAGAAPGKHTNYLSRLFPDAKFVLVDPNPFSCEEGRRIKIIQDFFTDDLAKLYSDRKTLFISDIRTADPSILSSDDVEEYVKSDMDAQQRWHLLLNPVRSMLKFRLPWGGGKTNYLAGDVYLPIWGPQTTSETRLIAGGKAMKDWDNSLYENQMFYFNTHTRVQCYDHDVNLPGRQGLDHCYDCTAEIHVLREYLTKYPDRWWPNFCRDHKLDPSSSPTPDHYARRIVEMSKEISYQITHGGRNLSHPQPPPEHRGKMGQVKFHEILPQTGYIGTGVLESDMLSTHRKDGRDPLSARSPSQPQRSGTYSTPYSTHYSSPSSSRPSSSHGSAPVLGKRRSDSSASDISDTNSRNMKQQKVPCKPSDPRDLVPVNETSVKCTKCGAIYLKSDFPDAWFDTVSASVSPVVLNAAGAPQPSDASVVDTGPACSSRSSAPFVHSVSSVLTKRNNPDPDSDQETPHKELKRDTPDPSVSSIV